MDLQNSKAPPFLAQRPLCFLEAQNVAPQLCYAIDSFINLDQYFVKE